MLDTCGLLQLPTVTKDVGDKRSALLVSRDTMFENMVAIGAAEPVLVAEPFHIPRPITAICNRTNT